MPCIKCANGKWKYGQRGRCQFDTLEACQAAAAAIHAQEKAKSGCSGVCCGGDEPCCGKCTGELSMQDLFTEVNKSSKF